MAELFFEQYNHHGDPVWVRSDLKGRHKEHCLCYQCCQFHPNDRDLNCPIAEHLFTLDRLHNLVTPVWECPDFWQK